MGAPQKSLFNRLGISRLLGRPSGPDPNRHDWPVTLARDTQVSAHQDGIAVLHIPSGKVFVCNRLGARIWQWLSEGMNPQAVCEKVRLQYGVTQEVAQRDTRAFLDELEQNGLIVRKAS